MNFNHLKEIQESYLDHAAFAVGISAMLFSAAIVGMIHAIFPFILTNSVTNIVNMLAATLKYRVVKK